LAEVMLGRFDSLGGDAELCGLHREEAAP
jgi:hypothetical protein